MSNSALEDLKAATEPHLVVWPEFLSEIEFLDKIASWSLAARVRGEALFEALDHLRHRPRLGASVVGASQDGLPVLAVSFPPFLLRFVIRGRYVIVLSYFSDGPGPAKAARRRPHFSGLISTIFEDVYAVATFVVSAPRTYKPNEVPFLKLEREGVVRARATSRSDRTFNLNPQIILDFVDRNAAVWSELLIINHSDTGHHDVKNGTISDNGGFMENSSTSLATDTHVHWLGAALSCLSIKFNASVVAAVGAPLLSSIGNAVLLAADNDTITGATSDTLIASMGAAALVEDMGSNLVRLGFDNATVTVRGTGKLISLSGSANIVKSNNAFYFGGAGISTFTATGDGVQTLVGNGAEKLLVNGDLKASFSMAFGSRPRIGLSNIASYRVMIVIAQLTMFFPVMAASSVAERNAARASTLDTIEKVYSFLLLMWMKERFGHVAQYLIGWYFECHPTPTVKNFALQRIKYACGYHILPTRLG